MRISGESLSWMGTALRGGVLALAVVATVVAVGAAVIEVLSWIPDPWDIRVLFAAWIFVTGAITALGFRGGW